MVGTKLQVIITKMGLRIQERGEVVKGTPVVEPGDDLFWFNQPRLILYLINFVLFQVSSSRTCKTLQQLISIYCLLMTKLFCDFVFSLWPAERIPGCLLCMDLGKLLRPSLSFLQGLTAYFNNIWPLLFFYICFAVWVWLEILFPRKDRRCGHPHINGVSISRPNF